MILKFCLVQAEHFCVDNNYLDIVLARSAKSLVVNDIGTEHAALFSFNFRDRACGRKQVGRLLFDQRTMLNGEICRPIDLS
jgi:hypothetical protein